MPPPGVVQPLGGTGAGVGRAPQGERPGHKNEEESKDAEGRRGCRGAAWLSHGTQKWGVTGSETVKPAGPDHEGLEGPRRHLGYLESHRELLRAFRYRIKVGFCVWKSVYLVWEV